MCTYYQPATESEENLYLDGNSMGLTHLLDERHLNYSSEGVLQLQDYLRLQDYCVNHKRLRKMGLMTLYPKPNLS